MSRHPKAATPPSTLSIRKDLWYPAPVRSNVSPAPAPRLSIVTKLLPLVALIFGYSAAVTSSRHLDPAASLLLCGAFVCLLRMGYAVARFAVASVRHHRLVTGR